MSEGFYPPDEWQPYPEIDECGSADTHEPHFFIPGFLDPNMPAPDFVCGGLPCKILDMEAYR